MTDNRRNNRGNPGNRGGGRPRLRKTLVMNGVPQDGYWTVVSVTKETIVIEETRKESEMSKYTTGETFDISREEISNGITETSAHTEKLTILEVLPVKPSVFRVAPTQSYKVSRHFVANGVDTTNTVILTERDIDNIVR
jgi:hypothetical protein